MSGCAPAGVSGNKCKALKDLAAKTLDGTVPSQKAIGKMADAEVIERLTAVRGIGPWTVEMLLIFRMGRPDVLPVTDYGVRKGFALTFLRLPKTRPMTAEDLPKADVLIKRGKRWAPFRSVASWYLWRACDLAKGTLRRPLGTIVETAASFLRSARDRDIHALRQALYMHSWPLLSTSARESVAGDRGDAGLGRALPRLE